MFLLAVENPNGTRLISSYTSTNDTGGTIINFTIPIEAEAGTYQCVVYSKGEVVATTSIVVVFDETLYNRYLISQIRDELNQYKRLVALYNTAVRGDWASRNTLILLVASALMICAISTTFAFMVLKETVPYVMGKEKDKRGARRMFHTLFHLPVKGVMGTFIHHVPAKFSDTRKKKIEEALKDYQVKATLIKQGPDGELVLDNVELADLTDLVIEAVNKKTAAEPKKERFKFRLRKPKEARK